MGIFDDLFLLRSFVSIVENGSISAAARSLRLPQPTISRHLASLEEKCGGALLSVGVDDPWLGVSLSAKALWMSEFKPLGEQGC